MSQPFIPFPATVRAVRKLSPSFVRITFGGAELAHFADNGADQRIKLVLPAPGVPEPGDLFTAASGDWYQNWLSVPAERRNPLRTYTVRAVRAERCEVDVDLVLHGDHGPASRWAGAASVGDRIHLIGPNARYEGSTAALGWNPPPGRPFLFIAGDETALPATAAILEGLPDDARGRAVVEVAGPDDQLPLRHPRGIELEWTTRAGRPHGVQLEAAVRAAAAVVLDGRTAAPDDDETDETPVEDLWDVPEPVEAADAYAWLAGEAGCVARLRRHLVRELGFPRTQVAFMGYWRAGAASE